MANPGSEDESGIVSNAKTMTKEIGELLLGKVPTDTGQREMPAPAACLGTFTPESEPSADNTERNTDPLGIAQAYVTAPHHLPEEGGELNRRRIHVNVTTGSAAKELVKHTDVIGKVRGIIKPISRPGTNELSAVGTSDSYDGTAALELTNVRPARHRGLHFFGMCRSQIADKYLCDRVPQPGALQNEPLDIDPDMTKHMANVAISRPYDPGINLIAKLDSGSRLNDVFNFGDTDRYLPFGEEGDQGWSFINIEGSMRLDDRPYIDYHGDCVNTLVSGTITWTGSQLEGQNMQNSRYLFDPGKNIATSDTTGDLGLSNRICSTRSDYSTRSITDSKSVVRSNSDNDVIDSTALFDFKYPNAWFLLPWPDDVKLSAKAEPPDERRPKLNHQLSDGQHHNDKPCDTNYNHLVLQSAKPC
jgi:hypothetical protein